MILEIRVHTDWFGGDSREKFFVAPELLETGCEVDLASRIFRNKIPAGFSPFKAFREDDGGLTIVGPAGRQTFEPGVVAKYVTPEITISKSTVTIEGETYDDENTVKVEITIMPRFAYAWDELTIERGDARITFSHDDLPRGRCLIEACNEPAAEWLSGWRVWNRGDYFIQLRKDDERITLDASTEEKECGEIKFALESRSTLAIEWDDLDEQPRTFRVNTDDLINSEHDDKAAYSVAEQIAEQSSEALEIIASYMYDACELGNKDAQAWLKDYYGGDSRWDPYA